MNVASFLPQCLLYFLIAYTFVPLLLPPDHQLKTCLNIFAAANIIIIVIVVALFTIPTETELL